MSRIRAKSGNTGGPLQPQIRSCGEDSRAKPEMHFQIAREGLSGVKLTLKHGMTSGSTNFTKLFQIQEGPACIIFNLFPKKEY